MTETQRETEWRYVSVMRSASPDEGLPTAWIVGPSGREVFLPEAADLLNSQAEAVRKYRAALEKLIRQMKFDGTEYEWAFSDEVELCVEEADEPLTTLGRSTSGEG